MLLTRGQEGSTPLAVNHWGPLRLDVLAKNQCLEEVKGAFWGYFLGGGG